MAPHEFFKRLTHEDSRLPLSPHGPRRPTRVDSKISDIPAGFSASLLSLNLGRQASREETVVIALGPGGIDRIDVVARACAAFFSEPKLTPVIAPVMGSQGGGTPEGQRKCLEELETIDHLSLRTSPAPMEFDPVGNLLPFPE